jgi:hypothetical protein
VLGCYEITLRSYGALSTTFRRKAGWIQNPPVHTPPQESVSLPDTAVVSTIDQPTPPSLLLPPPNPSSAPPEEDSKYLRKRKRSWARLIAKVWLDDPTLCSSCQKPMKIIAASVG